MRRAAVWVLRGWKIALGVIAIAALLAYRRRKRTSEFEPGTGARRRANRSGVIAVYERIARQVAKAGFARGPATTPRELATAVAIAREPMAELVELYYAALWGGRSDAAAERRAGELATQVEAAIRKVHERGPRTATPR